MNFYIIINPRKSNMLWAKIEFLYVFNTGKFGIQWILNVTYLEIIEYVDYLIIILPFIWYLLTCNKQ